MSGRRTNGFGVNWPVTDHAAMLEALDVQPGHRVLEVGGAGNALARADVVCDLTFASCAQRNGAPGVFRRSVRYVEAPAEELPFADGEFDFVWCTQVLEHVRDPVRACRELGRVARRGFVEVPSRFGELSNGNPSHRWIIDREADTLVFTPRHFIEHPLHNFFYGLLFRDPGLRRASEVDYRNLFNHQVLFEGGLPCRLAPAPAGGEPFDYDRPGHAARAHFSFARNVLALGAEPGFAWPDALEASRLAPTAPAARVLLAVFLCRLQKPEEAVAALEGVAGAMATELRRLAEGQRLGRCVRPESLPLPEGRLDLPPRRAEAGEGRPLVSVVVAGAGPEALRDAAESALTQDYPAVEVVVSAACEEAPLEERFRGLEMGARLRLLAQGGGAGLGACLNRGSLETRGAFVGYLMEGDRYLSHHVDRLVAELLATGASAVHADRLVGGEAGVVDAELVPGRPEAATVSLSTLIARRAALEEVGFFDEEREGWRTALDFLLRLAGSGGLRHLREATVWGRLPLPEGASGLDAGRAAMGVDPLELLRSLMSAHVREEGLRRRIAELEGELEQLGQKQP